MKWIYFLFWGVLFVFASCTPKDALLEHALEKAGTNRAELEKVLNRYRDTDEEKYRAACFLIRNMPFYHSYEGKELEKYLRYYKARYADGGIIRTVVDSIRRADGEFSMATLRKRKDTETVDSAFLVTHIDWAFKVWREQPWGKNVSFADFCEYILPYRIGDEPLSLWRKKLYEEYNPILDSLRTTPSADNPLQAAQVLLTHLRKEKYLFTASFPEGPHVGPDILQWRVGICRDFADGMMYACRAVGVPCGTDRVLMRGDCNSGHSWNFVLDSNRVSYSTDFPRGRHWKPGKKYSIKRKGKVYRTTFSLNEDWTRQGQEVPPTHPTFRTPFFHDVTAEYLDEQAEYLEIPKENLITVPQQNEKVYLCLSNKQTWVPIAYQPYKGGNLRFRDVEGGITCVAGVWRDGYMAPVTEPFYVEGTTLNIHPYTPEASKQQVSVRMKFHMPVYDVHHRRMLGGVFEGSDSKDFRNADTLYTVTRTPYRRYTVARLTTDKPYRYIRYRSSKEQRSNVAELSFYAHADDTIPLCGKMIADSESLKTDGRYRYTNAFDGNTETSFDYLGDSIGWVGMDFGRPVRIEKVVYTPANRVNFIYKGYDYELYYWGDGCWNSLGRQTATADSLVYQAPVNALLYLKCYTAGKDERIFEYKDGEQIFR